MIIDDVHFVDSHFPLSLKLAEYGGGGSVRGLLCQWQSVSWIEATGETSTPVWISGYLFILQRRDRKLMLIGKLASLKFPLMVGVSQRGVQLS